MIGWSRSLDSARAQALGIVAAQSPTQVAEQSDAVSIHLAYAADTAGIIGEAFFAALPEQAMVINVSRAGVVDEAACLRAMNQRGIRYATDVFDGEPSADLADFEHPLAQHPLSICTPHIGAATTQAQEAVAKEAVRIVEVFCKTGRVENCVNLRAKSATRFLLSVRHRDQVGVLAGVLSTVREAGVNVQELENVLFEGGKTAWARIGLANTLADDVVARIRTSEGVLNAELVGCP
ncbi:MAG: NAD(P)-dependent oxidoreductase [Myxococcota bacterium]